MWERAPCSCRLEIVFMRDLYLSVSPSSCHCTQWVGAPSEWQKTNTSQPRRVTFHISVIKASRASLCDSGLADVGSVANHSASFTWAVPAPSYFSPLWRHIRSLLNVNTFRAGQESDRETDEGLLKGPVCVCVRVCVWVCLCFCPPASGKGPLTTSRIPPSALYSLGTCQPDVEPLHWQPQIQPPQHGDPHSRDAAPTFTSQNRAALYARQPNKDMQFLHCNFFAPYSKSRKTLIDETFTWSFAIK